MPFHILQNTLDVSNKKQDSNIFPWHKSSPFRIVKMHLAILESTNFIQLKLRYISNLEKT